MMLQSSCQVQSDQRYLDPMYLFSVANAEHPGGSKIILKYAGKDAS